MYGKLVLLLALVPIIRAALPGLLIQVNQKGINQFTAVGIQLLDQKIPGTHIPDTSGKSEPESKSLFSWNLHNIYVREFHVDTNHADVSLHPADNVAVRITNLHAKLTADYHIELGSGWLSIKKDGNIDAETNDASASVSVDVTSSGDGHPALAPHSCGSDLGGLQIHFHGGIIDEIMDLFEGEIAGYVKGKVSGIICEQVQSIITNEGNNYLRQVPISIALPGQMHDFDIDYGLTSNPIATNNYIAVPLLAKLWYTGHENDAGIPPAHGTIAPANSDKDLCLDFDADEIFGSAAYALEVSPLSQFNIDQDVLGHFGSAIQRFMRCHCDDDHLCIGEWIPQVGAACGADGVVDVSAQANAAVNFAFNSSGAYGDLQATAGFQSHMPNGNKADLFHVTVVADLEVPSDFHFENWAIKGKVLVTGADMKLGSSLIGDIDISAVQHVWDMVLKMVVQSTISQLLEAGIPLPQIPYVRIENPQIYFAPHALTFCTDAVYTG